MESVSFKLSQSARKLAGFILFYFDRERQSAPPFCPPVTRNPKKENSISSPIPAFFPFASAMMKRWLQWLDPSPVPPSAADFSSLCLKRSCLEELELLAGGSENLVLLHLQHVESDGLGEGPALSDGHDISLLHVEGRRAVHGDVPVALLEPVVLGDVVEVMPSDHNGAVHLGGDDHTLDDTASDGHVGGEGALLVDVGSLLGLIGSVEPQADVLEPPEALLCLLRGNEDGVLLLERLLVLHFKH
mmetsp:Transcript_17148/g.34771  ORF Transcript_17148/g.34771 Transcript_17148/m.34771 type:complete len:245 (+) Transcript_17148:189-923(+)